MQLQREAMVMVSTGHPLQQRKRQIIKNLILNLTYIRKSKS